MTEKIIDKNNYIHLTDLGIVQISGKDSKQFLQGQLTCNIEEVSVQQSRIGAHCDAKGRIIATFLLFFYQNDYYFLLPRSMVTYLLTSLQKYAIFSKVTLSEVSKDWQKIGLYGSSIANVLGARQLSTAEENRVTQFAHSLILSISGPIARVILLTPASDSIEFISTKFKQQSNDHWYLLDIMARIPTIYPETSGQFTPHQLNFPEIGGVSFNKGCYIGQEIIARTHYLGKPKSRLYRVSFEAKNPPLPGTPLLENGETVKGAIIMSAREEDSNHYQALVCLQTQAISHTIRLGNLEGPILDFLEKPLFY